MNNKRWYCIEISYDSQSETKLFRIPNLSSDALDKFRNNVFIGGAYRRIDDETGEIISPWRIRNIMVYKQAHFFNADQEDKKLTQKNPDAKTTNKG